MLELLDWMEPMKDRQADETHKNVFAQGIHVYDWKLGDYKTNDCDESGLAFDGITPEMSCQIVDFLFNSFVRVASIRLFTPHFPCHWLLQCTPWIPMGLLEWIQQELN